ncbi:hypothetical protein LH53_04105 [Mesotoga sp. TolDC]|nr:hypothetical protein LH53_04105 [Mesotoga sp. TolDC]
MQNPQTGTFWGRLYGMTILGDSVGANGCSPEEGEALSQAQGRSQKFVGLLTQARHIRQGSPSKDPLVACQETLNAWKSKGIKNKVNRQRSTVL